MISPNYGILRTSLEKKDDEKTRSGAARVRRERGNGRRTAERDGKRSNLDIRIRVVRNPQDDGDGW